MQTNVGDVDRTLRILLAVVIATGGIYFHSFWGLIAAIPFLTAAFAWCPAYLPLGLNTCE